MNQDYWWQRTDLCYKNNQLNFAGRDVLDLLKQASTPAFYYSANRVLSNISRVKEALNNNGFLGRHKLFYAMKANRFSPLLTWLKTKDLCGIDTCSPQEVEHAISCGFVAEEISFTACSLSKQDISKLSCYSGLIMNCDSLHSIESWGKLKPGTNIGIRINPAIGTGRSNNEKLQYTGNKVTKFGIYKEQFQQAVALAKKYNLTINRIHFHTGCGFLNSQLAQLKQILIASLWFIQQCPDVTNVNIGGGLGVRHTHEDESLDLDLWAQTIYSVMGSLDVQLELEPGDYLLKDAGILIVEKTFQELKQNKLFIGVNAGFNLAPEPAYYGMPFEPVALIDNTDKQIVNIVGNINEALDVWYENFELANIENQNHLAIINSGAYSSSMSSNHCMRGEFKEFLLF